MAADFSHNPADLPRLLAACVEGGADMSVGSRYCDGINVVNWPMGRIMISYCVDRADRVCGAVRRTVVDYQYMIVALDVRHRGNYLLNVFNFIVCRDYYEFFHHTESIYVDTNLVFFV